MQTRTIDCVVCKQPGYPLITGIPVCAICLRSPDRRPILYAGLSKGQAARRSQNQETP